MPCKAVLTLFLLAVSQIASADLLHSITTQRHWIGYAPRNSNPNIGLQPSQAQIRADLELLYDQGWRSLYTYSLDGTIQHAARIAKEVGFDQVLAGVFYFNEGQLAREKAAAQAQQQYIDGYIVGNEGLVFGRYNKSQLIDAINFFEGFGKPIGTTEVGGSYFNDPSLLDLGDFTYVNIQPWFNGSLNPFNPAAMAAATAGEFRALQQLRPNNTVIIKEAWWPTAGHPAATEANQVAFFEALSNQTDLSGDPVRFSWGESFDQTWKSEPGPFATLGPDWGLSEEDGTEKLIIDELRDIYTSPYPGAIELGDYDANGTVDLFDYLTWSQTFGTSPASPGAGADGNGNGIVDIADFTIWRDVLGPISALAVPEPNAVLQVSVLMTCLAVFRGRRG